MATAARPDLQAYNHAHRVAPAQATAELIDILGARLVAYIAGVNEARAVREWAAGEREFKRPDTEMRLRHALHIAKFIADAETTHAAQSWFQGLNPQLNDRSPARLLREGDVEEIGPEIAAAARAFVIGG
jgi:hypothetical protein